MNTIYHADCLAVLPSIPKKSVRLIYIDPPFNTGKTQSLRTVQVRRDDVNGTRNGFGGKRYTERVIKKSMYADQFDDYSKFLLQRIQAAIPALTDDGSLFVHLDYRETHYVKCALDKILGRGNFINEIIWSYDYGGRSKKRWPCKHDTILWYAMDPDNYVFKYEDIDRIPYLAPGLVGAEKAARGKVPTDVWWNTIVPTNGKERTGYPTQKPIAILDRIIRTHSYQDDVVMDFFAGSGTTGESAAKNNRKFILMDSSDEAIRVMDSRLSQYKPKIKRVGRRTTGLKTM